MTTYCSQTDLDNLLEGFVANYYGTFLNDGEELTVGTQFGIDLGLSFEETNEWLGGISHIKTIPIGTQPTTGNYPQHIRMVQANLMIYARLKGRHYGEFTNGIPGWITTYLSQAKQILADIKGQNVVFEDDTYQGESGIGVGSFVTKTGAARWYSNWETGVYTADDFPRVYAIEIDGAGGVGTATFKASNDNGVTWGTSGVPTDANWVDIGAGLQIRWETVGTGTNQCAVGDRFAVKCVPLNIPVKSGNMRYITWKRG